MGHGKGRWAASMRNGNSKCVILVPVLGQIEPATEVLLVELQRRGYHVKNLIGNAYIDKARSIMATKALEDGYEEIVWIDQDMTFDPGAVDVLRSHGMPVVGGIYAIKSKEGGLAVHLLNGWKTLNFGLNGGLIEIRWAATGFLYTKREVYEKIKEKFKLPTCGQEYSGEFIPYFHPLIFNNDGIYNYLGEDFSFCERARQCGYKIYADTTIRLGHIGKYTYYWEDFAGDRPRAQTFELEFEE